MVTVKHPERFIVVYVVLVLSLLAIAIHPTITGLATSNETTGTDSSASVAINLDGSKFAVNSNISGTVTLSVEESLAPSEQLTITVNGRTYSYAIGALLEQQNATLEYETVDYNATVPATEKALSFASASSQVIGLQIPRYAEVESFTFSLEGSSYQSAYPKHVRIDVGDEGTVDWFYLGDLTGYTGTKISSTDLDGTAEGTGYIEDNGTFYCEYIDLPLGKHYKVSANYSKVGSLGDLQAVILSVPTGDPEDGWSGGSDTCDMPETAGSCAIELSYPVDGMYLVCLYSTGPYTDGKSLYALPLDTSAQTDTAYSCPIPEFTETSSCEAATFSNFFIYAEAGEYNGSIVGSVDVADWETFGTALLTAIQYYVGTEPYKGICTTTICAVPLNISSESAGTVTISDASVTYVYNGVTQSTSTLYDLRIPIADITAVDSQVLADGADISIVLKPLGISVADLGEYTIEATFLGANGSALFSAVEATEIYDAPTLIATAIDTFSAFLDESTSEYDVIVLLDKVQTLEHAVEQLQGYKDQVGFVEEKDLLGDVETLLADKPWEIAFSQTRSDTLSVGLSDIPSSLGDETAIYLMQDLVEVTGTKENVDVNTFDGTTTSYTLIHIEVEATESISGATLYQIAPVSFDSLAYSTRPSTFSEDTATYEDITLEKGEKESYYFLTTDDVALADFKTLIVLPAGYCEDDTDCEHGYVCEANACVVEAPTYVCGDAICDSPDEDEGSCPEDCEEGVSALVIVIPIVLLIIAGIVLYVFKDKLFKKKPVAGKPGARPAGKDPLAEYIRQSLAKKIPENIIIDSLKKRGWKEPQIRESLNKAKTPQ